jgi:hypothetical protein
LIQSSNPNELEHRLTKLERSNRMLMLLLVLSLFLIGALLYQAMRVTVVKTTALQLLNTDGEVSAELAVRAGYPGLYLMDNQHKTRLALFHAEDGTGLSINDASETTRIGIAQFAHGGGGVALHGADSKGALVLYYKKDGSLRFFDPQGKVIRAVLGVQQTEPESLK